MDNTQLAFDINFLRKRKKELSAIEKTDKKYAMWMGYVVGSLIFLLLFVTGVNFFFSTRISRVKAEAKKAQNDISDQKNIEEQYLTLAEKMKFITQILSDKAQKSEAIQFFTETFSTDTTSIKEMRYEDSGTLIFQLNSTNIFVLQEAIAVLSSQEVRDNYNSVVMSDITRDSQGQYIMQVLVTLKAPEEPEPEKETEPKANLEEFIVN